MNMYLIAFLSVVAWLIVSAFLVMKNHKANSILSNKEKWILLVLDLSWPVTGTIMVVAKIVVRVFQSIFRYLDSLDEGRIS